MLYEPIGPALLEERLTSFPIDLQLLGLTACAACREKHSGWCINDITEGRSPCEAERALKGFDRSLGAPDD